jgi:hypothetical protein
MCETLACQPLGAWAACEMGFLDDAFGEDAKTFEAELRERAARLTRDPELRVMLRKRHERRLDDEAVKPLASSTSRVIAPRSWDGCGSTSSGPTPLTMRLAKLSCSKGIRRRGRAERRFRQPSNGPSPSGSSHGELLGLSQRMLARPLCPWVGTGVASVPSDVEHRRKGQ